MACVTFEKLGEAIAESEIVRFEKEIDRQLPNDYRDFLGRHNGGVPVPGFFMDGSDYNRIILLFSLHTQSKRGLRKARLDYGDSLSPRFLSIGRDLGQEPICLDLGPDDYGAIYLTDGCVEDMGSEVAMRRRTGSFGELLESLVDPDSGKAKNKLEEFVKYAKPEDLPGFLAKDPNMKLTNEQGWNLFLEVCASGKLALVRELIRLGVNTSEGIHFALNNHKWEVAYFLAESV